MIIDIAAAKERLKVLDVKISQKQADVSALIKAQKEPLKPQLNISGLNTQLSLLSTKIDGAHEYLEQSKRLSSTINSGISSLEIRKKCANDTLNLFTDVVELRGSVKMVKKALGNIQHSSGSSSKTSTLENLETATYFTEKSMTLIQVIEP